MKVLISVTFPFLTLVMITLSAHAQAPPATQDKESHFVDALEADEQGLGGRGEEFL